MVSLPQLSISLVQQETKFPRLARVTVGLAIAKPAAAVTKLPTQPVLGNAVSAAPTAVNAHSAFLMFSPFRQHFANSNTLEPAPPQVGGVTFALPSCDLPANSLHEGSKEALPLVQQSTNSLEPSVN